MLLSKRKIYRIMNKKNRNMKSIYLLVLILTMISFSSCEDLLTEDPPSLISYENLNEDTLEAAISGMYEPMTRSRGRLWESTFTLGNELQADYANRRAAWLSSFEQYEFERQSAGATWTSFFQCIGRANLLINRINSSDIGPDLKENAIAEARFVRGIIYYYVVRSWGKVPLRTEATLSADDADAPLAEIEDIYEVIINDLKFAEENLNDTTDMPGRATSGAAKLFLADVYLTREDWQNARDKSKEVIDNKATYGYELEPDFSLIFSHNSPTNSSDVFSIKFHEAVGFGSFLPAYIAPRGPGNIAVDGGVAARGIFNLVARGNCDLIANWDDNDPRKSLNLYTELEINGEMVPVNLEGIADYAFGKFKDPSGIEETAAGNDFYLMRYADALLIFAEAENMLNNGPTDDAYEAINRVRRRGFGLDPYTPDATADLPTGLSMAEFDDITLRERGYEFMLEGKRWFDLVRKDRFDLIQQSKGITPSLIYWSLPPPEILTNDDID